MIDVAAREAMASAGLTPIMSIAKLRAVINQLIEQEAGDISGVTASIATLDARESADVASLGSLIAALSSRTAVANTNYTVLATDRNVAFTSITAARVVTLPAASAYPTGTQLLIFDESGSCSNTLTISVNRAGSDAISGASSAVINTPYGFFALESNGSNKWTIVDQSNNMVGRAAVSDAPYTVTTKDRTVAYTALTAARVVTLPAANTFAPGAQLLVYDESGAASSTNTITVTRAGSDTVNGLASIAISTAYGFVVLVSNGAAKWTVVDQSATTTTPTTRTPVADTAYTALTTDRYVSYTSLTASRIVTLPSAASFPVATRLLIIDETGSCSASRTITLARAGSDTINGLTSFVLNSPYDCVAIESDGASKWTIIDDGSPPNDYNASSDPTSSDDITKGFSPGSLKFRSDTGDAWRCRSAAAGAAVWVRMDVADFFGHVLNNWYLPAGLTSTANGTAHGANAIRFHPLIIKQRCTLSALGLYVRTASAGGNIQIAVYGANASTKRPTGTALVSTASMTTASITQVNAAVSVQVEPGLYWAGTNCDNATAAAIAIANSVLFSGQIIGSATEANITGFQTSLHFTVTQTYGTWPDMTSTTVTEVSNSTNYMPVVHYQIGSTP